MAKFNRKQTLVLIQNSKSLVISIETSIAIYKMFERKRLANKKQ